jgi:hypothetical protein
MQCIEIGKGIPDIKIYFFLVVGTLVAQSLLKNKKPPAEFQREAIENRNGSGNYWL